MKDNINIVPTPKGWWRNGQNCFTLPIIGGDFKNEAEVFAELAGRLGFDISLGDGGMTLVCDTSMTQGEYKIVILPDGKVTISAADSEGAHYALASLLQMCRNYDSKLLLDCVSITDKPDCEYRGLLIDCARSLHPVSQMKQYIDMCWLYKIHCLHIHLSDDESYAIPSKAFPKLPTPGRSYTYEEIGEICAYARSRGIEIVPEVDSPGHCTTLQNAYPEVFGDKGILSFTASAVEGMSIIYKEVCEMFPDSKYIHIGGDEGRLGWWIDDAPSAEYAKNFGYSPSDEGPGMSSNEYLMLRYLAHFIAENAKTVISCGKTPIVWEGFHKVTNGMIPKEVAVMVFDSSYQLASSLVADGFKVINCSWLPTYVVTPTWYYSERSCFDWDIFSFGTINEQSPYANGMMRMPETPLMIGGQLSSWGDSVEKGFESPEAGRADEMEKVRRRLPYISENTWNKSARADFDTVSTAVNNADKIFGMIV